MACTSPPARAQCLALRALLRQSSLFALKLTHTDTPLPHAKEMKLQCGGLRGVQLAVESVGAGHDSVAQGLPQYTDVHSLVQAGAEKFGGLQNLPYSAIVQSVVAYQLRRRRVQ